jgi:TonB-dependent SusC/RagA subfamily outer membrane receptor
MANPEKYLPPCIYFLKSFASIFFKTKQLLYMKKIKIPGSMKSFIWFIAAVFLLHPQIFAQQKAPHVVKGTVTSAVSKTPLVGATVYVKGTKEVLMSDSKGDYSIMASTGDVLVVSYVGFKEKEVKVGAGVTTINFELSEDPNSRLQDVVVVGYGKMKKSDLSSAVVSISSADINRTVNVTLDEALQGKAANVYVSQTSGQPGAGSSVIIRGVSTVTGNYQPLYVIDGVQIRPSAPTGGAYNMPASESNALAGINPDDIENISVLQGPAATSIYGQAGSNGVLVITTKHGKAGPTKVSASTLYSIQDKPKERPVMNLKEYAVYMKKVPTGRMLYSAALHCKNNHWQ